MTAGVRDLRHDRALRGSPGHQVQARFSATADYTASDSPGLTVDNGTSRTPRPR